MALSFSGPAGFPTGLQVDFMPRKCLGRKEKAHLFSYKSRKEYCGSDESHSLEQIDVNYFHKYRDYRRSVNIITLGSERLLMVNALEVESRTSFVPSW